MIPPTLVAHADWSLRPEKRWLCIAESSEPGTLRVSEPEPAGPSDSLLTRLVDRARAGAGEANVLLGIDVPIGLPSAYAAQAGIESFLSILPRLGHGEWADFYRVAERPEEVSRWRPFYPMRPGGAAQKHLTDGLGVEDMTSLLREAERATESRGAAAPLFWTMGARQVGKAAIAAWREVLAPAFSATNRDVALWPFQGSLRKLLPSHEVTIAEVYPADACVQLGIGAPGRGWSKRSQDDRRTHAGALCEWAELHRVELAPELVAVMLDGFGDQLTGEDQFDAMVGLFSMIDVVQGRRPEGAPTHPTVRSVEGWILGHVL